MGKDKSSEEKNLSFVKSGKRFVTNLYNQDDDNGDGDGDGDNKHRPRKEKKGIFLIYRL